MTDLVKEFGLDIGEPDDLVSEFGLDLRKPPEVTREKVAETLTGDELPYSPLQTGDWSGAPSLESPVRAATVKSLPTRFMAGAGSDVAALSFAEGELGQQRLGEARELVRRMSAGYEPRIQQLSEIERIYALKAKKDGAGSVLAELDKQIEDAKTQTAIAEMVGSSYEADIKEATPPDETFLEQAVGTVARSGASLALGLSVAPISGPGAVVVGASLGGLAATGQSYRDATEYAEKNGLTLTPDQKMRIAVTDGFLEGLGERFSLKVALKAGPMVLRRYLEVIGAEASSEAVTEMMQTANAALNYNDKITLQEFLYATALAGTAGAIGGGGVAGIVHGAQAVQAKVEEARHNKLLDRAVSELLASEEPALLSPEQEAVRLLDPKVSGRPMQTPQESFDHLLRTSPYEAAGFAIEHQEALGPEFSPVRRAKELFTDGNITREQFVGLRKALLEISAQQVEGGGALKGTLEDIAKSEDAIVEATPDYIPTEQDLIDSRLAQTAKAYIEQGDTDAARQVILTMSDASLVQKVIKRIFVNPDNIGRIERKREKLGGLGETQQDHLRRVVDYFERATNRQREGLYPFSYEMLASEERQTVVLPWERVNATWSNMGDLSSTRVNLGALREGEVIQVGQQRDVALTETISDWVRRFAPSMKLIVVADENAATQLGFLSPLDRLFGSSIGGAFIQPEPGVGVIYISSTTEEAVRAEHAAHEFGHALFTYLLAKSPTRVRQAMMRAWGRDVSSKLKMPLNEFLKTHRGAMRAPEHDSASRYATLGDAIAVDPYFREYINNWDEWSAHQMERALARDFRGMQEPVRKFFKKYIEMFRRFWNGVVAKENQTFEEFVMYHHQRAQAKEAAFFRYSVLEDNLRKFGFESVTPEEAQDAQRFLLQALGKMDAPQDLIDSMVTATPALRARAKLAIERIGPSESGLLTPVKDVPVTLSAEEYTQTLEDAWLPGQGVEAVYNMVRTPSTKFSGRTASFLKNSLKYSKLLRGKFAADMSEYQGHLDKFGWFAKWAYMVEHVAKVNPHIEQLQAYVEHVREWARTRMAWIARADERLRKWRDLNATEQKILGKFLLDQTHKGEFFDLNNPDVIREYPLTERAKEIYAEIRSDFVDFMSAIEGALVESARKRLSQNPFAMAAEMERIRDRFTELKKQPYFPLSRFGKYLVIVRATRHIRIKGNLYNPGDVMHFEAFDTNFARMAELDKIKGMYPTGELKLDVASEAVRSLMGMPGPVLDAIKNDPTINLSPEQKKAVDEYLYKIAPGQSFSKHLIQRKGVEGYTEDVMRTYANYFFHGASHLARIGHSETMAEDIKAIDLTADVITSDASKRRAIANYMRRHYDFLINPENDWSAVRSVIAVAYLGAVLKTAMVNLTQVPMTTYPHLAAKYGDLKAINTIRKAYGDAMAMYHVTKPLSKVEEEAITRWSQGEPLRPGDEKIVTQWSKLTEGERRMLRQAVLEGWIDESQAMELAAMSEGSWMTRFKATSKVGYYWRTLSQYAMVPFQIAEKLNRRVTAISAYRLAIESGAGHDAAYKAAREAVSATQYEYAKWNRAELLRGKKGVFFMFWQFMLNTLFFATGGDKGWWRWWGMMLATAGVMGLPFAENLLDLATWAFSREDKRFNARYELRKAVEQFAETLMVSPDLLLHGISRYGFGLIPFADMSGSMSMGQIIPGTELLASSGAGKFSDRVAMGVKEAGGATTSLVMRLLQAVSEDDPDILRRIERGMPVTIGQQVLSAMRWYRDGANTMLNGAELTRFDVNDPWQLAEIIGKGALGLQPRSIAAGRPEEGQPGREEMMLRQDFANYYRVRREVLLRKLDHELRLGDHESKTQVIDAIRKYNQAVPSPALRISGDTINRMRREKARARHQLEQGAPPQRMFHDLYRRVEDREL